MKILQVPFHFYPDQVGGTETYVACLSKLLINLGAEVEIAAPAEANDRYIYEGVAVHRFAIRKRIDDLSELYGQGDGQAAKQFACILDSTRPDLVHLHALSPAVSLQVIAEVKKRHLPIVFTYHIAGITCQRGTLLQYGATLCDGVWAVNKCSRCVLQSRGLAKPLSQAFGTLPSAVGRAVKNLRSSGRFITALRMTELLTYRQHALDQFLRDVDQVVAVSLWVKELLIRNGIPASKIELSRHGATQMDGQRRNKEQRNERPGGLRVAFMGRLYPMKGVHILIEALRRRVDLPIVLDIYGIAQDQTSEIYMEKLKTTASGDPRIRFLPPVANDVVVSYLRGYDLLAVPSQCLETGPLAVYDAFSAGIPVLGSRLGGIAELVKHGRDGLLIEASDVDAWGTALESVVREPGLLERLRAGIEPPRTMAAVATEMMALYQRLLSKRPSLASATGDSERSVFNFDQADLSSAPTSS